jgi:glycosyltransferase involved in cell wall biosynthesis
MDGMSGIAYHRLYVPHFRMATNKQLDVVVNQRMEEWHAIDYKSVDLVIFNRWLGPRQEDILTDLAKNNIPYIVDVDDYWKLHGGHLAKKIYQKEVSKGIKQAVQYADGITTTTPIMSETLKKINPNAPIAELHNCIDFEHKQWNHKKKSSDKIRIGWVGGISHTSDMSLILDVFPELAKKHDIEVYVCGYTSGNDIQMREWSLLIDKFANGSRPSWLKIIDGLNPNEYGMLYTHFDIAIAPLQNTRFNHHKSPLKIAEAAAYNMPILVSAVNPYGLHYDNDGMIMVRNSTEDWIKRLTELIENPMLIDVMGKKNRQYCESMFNLNVVNQNRLSFYERCILNTQDRH